MILLEVINIEKQGKQETLGMQESRQAHGNCTNKPERAGSGRQWTEPEIS